MKKILILSICCLLSFYSVFSQEKTTNRIQNIENNIELLKVDIPGFTEKVNVNVTSTTLSNFLLAVSQIHKVNINVDEQLNSINIVNGFNDVTVADLMVFLVKEYDLDIEFTGNILSFKKFKKEKEKPKKKEVLVDYDFSSKSLSMDLTNDPLHEVFRKIMDQSGSNLLFSPSIKNKELNIYISKVPFESALDKLSLANNLEFEKTDDGFYVFNSLDTVGNDPRGNGGANSGKISRPKKRKTSFFYEILDASNKEVSVDFENTPISDIIYTLTDELNIDVFLASPIDNSGTATVKSKKITFDKLLTEILESQNASSGGAPQGQSGRNSQPSSSGGKLTYRKEGNLYYFGTENQLSLKKIEFVPLMHRSIELLGDATQSSSYGGGSSFNSGFNNGGFNNGGFNNGGFNNSFSQNQNQTGINQNSNLNNNISNRSNRSNNYGNNSSGNSSAGLGAITALFPSQVLEGIEVKVDTELNGFIVSGSAQKVQNFNNFIKYIDKPVPVILIEVMILEVSRNATVEAGVEFGLGEEGVTTQGVAFSGTDMTLGAATVNRVIGGFDGFGSLNLGKVLPNFYMNIKAMESNGNLKILSTPKLSTLNGHKAFLSSGQTTYFEVTNQSFYGSQIPQTSEVTNYQPIDAELSIEFKPFVAGDGQITLDIQVIQSSFGARTAENAPPDINSRQFSSIIRMQDNDVAILGGIEEKIKNDAGSGVPFLSRIPILKWLFSQRSRQDSKKKLNILVKPTVFY